MRIGKKYHAQSKHFQTGGGGKRYPLTLICYLEIFILETCTQSVYLPRQLLFGTIAVREKNQGQVISDKSFSCQYLLQR